MQLCLEIGLLTSGVLVFLCIPTVSDNRLHVGGSFRGVHGFVGVYFGVVVLDAGTPSAQTVSVSAKVGAPVSLAGQRFTVQIPSSQPAGKSGILGPLGMETGIAAQPRAAWCGRERLIQSHPLPWTGDTFHGAPSWPGTLQG